MIKFSKKKLLLSLILSFFSIMSLVIIFEARSEKSIKIRLADDSVHSHYKILNVRVGETEYPLEAFANDNVEHRDGELYVNGKNYEFEIKASVIENVTINFLDEKNSANVEVVEHSKYTDSTILFDLDKDESNWDFYYSNITIKEILRNSMKSMTTSNLVMFTCIFVIQTGILYMCMCLATHVLNKQKNSDLKVKDILLFILSMFIIIFSCLYLLLEVFNVLLIVPIAGCCIYIYYKYKVNTLHNMFFIYGTLFGILMLFILPPFHVPDEGTHYYKAYRLSYFNSDKLVINNAGTSKARMYINSNIADMVYEYTIDIHSTTYTLSAKSYLANMSENMNNTDIPKRSVAFGNTEILNPFCYIPTTILLFLCRLVDTPVLVSILLGRLLNFSIFILAGYYALKKIPIFKYTLFITMLLPICLQQEAAFNQDTITNSIIFLLFSQIIYLIYGKCKDLTFKDFIGVIILGCCLAFCKFTYFPILLLVFLIPKEKFKDPKKHIWLKSLVILPSMLFTFINIFSVSDTVATGDAYTVGDVISNPVQSVKLYLRTFISRFHVDFINNLVNGFGWSTVWNIGIFGFIIQLIFTIFYIVANNEEAKNDCVPFKSRIFIILLLCMIVGLIYSSLLIVCTIPGSEIISGLQSRYFIPAVLLFLVAITNDKIKLNVKDKNKFYFWGLVISYSMVFLNLIVGYYV